MLSRLRVARTHYTDEISCEVKVETYSTTITEHPRDDKLIP